MSEKKYTPVKLKEVDLKDYGIDVERLGRSGKITVREKTSLIQAKLGSFLARLARADGIEISEENEDDITLLYLYDVTAFLLKECIVVPEGEPPISDDELLEYPDELVELIGGIIGKGELPLTSSPGAESKTEQ